MRNGAAQEQVLHDLSKTAVRFGCVLAAMRYFQAAALSILLVYLTLAVTYTVILPPEIASGVWKIFVDAAISSPTTAQGYLQKVSMMTPLFLPLAMLVAAGVVANLERPGSVLILFTALGLAAFVLWVAQSMTSLFAEIPASFFYIHWVALPVNLFVIALVLYGVASVALIARPLRGYLRDGLGRRPWRTALFRLVGIPGFAPYLGARRWRVLPIFLLSSFLLAASLYPFFFAGAVANNLVRINRAECISLGAGRLECFEAAMRTDALLFPLYLLIGFLGPYSVYLLLRRWGRSMAIVSMQELLDSDVRPPVLFLRPFGDDQITLPKERRWSLFAAFRIGERAKTLEHQVLEELTELGPVVAIGDPSVNTVPYGAARDYVPDSRWQDDVGDLIDRSGAIVVVVNDTPGVWWEVQQILEKGTLEKALFVFPLDDTDEAQKLFAGLCDSLEAHGVLRPERHWNNGQVLGLYRTNGLWTIVTAQAPAEIDTLMLLRLFGTQQVYPQLEKRNSVTRNLFTLAFAALLALGFLFDDGIRLLKGDAMVGNQAQEATTGTGDQTRTVLGLDSGNELSKRYWLRQALFDHVTGGHVVFASFTDASPRLLWIDQTGKITREIHLRVPVRDRAPTGRSPVVAPVALAWDADAGLHVAFAIISRGPVTLAIRKFDSSGQEHSALALGPEHGLTSVQDVALLRDGTYAVAGQVTLSDQSRGPFIGRLGSDGVWAWSRRDFGGRGWANAVAQGQSGTIAAALEVAKTWRVVGLHVDGGVAFDAPLADAPGNSAAKAIAAHRAGGWLVAGRADGDSDRQTPTRPVAARLSADGTYTWVTPLADIEGHFVADILQAGEGVVVAANLSGVSDDSTALAVLDQEGAVYNVVKIAANGKRNVSDISLANDGRLWLFGRAGTFAANAAPVERMSTVNQPWIATVGAGSADGSLSQPKKPLENPE